MFEDALVESDDRIKTRTQYWSIVTLLMNGLILAALIIWPLLHPEALPSQDTATLLTAPPPRPSPSPAVVKVPAQTATLNNQRMSVISTGIKTGSESAPPTMSVAIFGTERMPGEDTGDSLGPIFPGGATGLSLRPAPPTKLNISSGVMAGNLLLQALPQYPPIARETHISGTVVLQATISRFGTIDNLRVMSGPPMLQRAALDAVRTWRYKPYLLNGEPVAVETTVNVVFDLGQ